MLRYVKYSGCNKVVTVFDKKVLPWTFVEAKVELLSLKRLIVRQLESRTASKDPKY